MEFAIQKIKITDYDEIYSLWSNCEGIGLSDADSRENIERYLKRNRAMSFVAKIKGRIVGTILAGHDGRRGYIHHLAVDKKVRQQGIGKQLVQTSLDAIAHVGIKKCHIFVFKENQRATDF